jgi:hypothetical protein
VREDWLAIIMDNSSGVLQERLVGVGWFGVLQERLVGVGWFKLKESDALPAVNLVTKECCPTPHCSVLVTRIK